MQHIIRPGTAVTVQGIKGRIHEAYIGIGDVIRYNFVYWDGNTRVSVTILADEVGTVPVKSTYKIGFTSDPQ